MDCKKHDSTPAVPGLCNLGNTCYLNAALQAVASSNTFVSCISDLYQAFQATAETVSEEPVSLVRKLQAGLRAAVKFVWQGPNDDEPPPSQQQLTAQAAQGRLCAALHLLLTALQPQDPSTPTESQQQLLLQQQQRPGEQQQQQQQRQQRTAAVHPGDVLSRLSWYVPEGVLEPGVQQDAAEALELLCDALVTELACWQQLHAHKWQQQQQGAGVGLQVLLQQDGTEQQQEQQQQQQPLPSQQNGMQQQQARQQQGVPRHEQHEQQQHHQQQQASFAWAPPLPVILQQPQPVNPGLTCQESSDTLLLQQQQQQQLHPRQQQQRTPPVQAPRRLPVVGHCVNEITCLACGDRFPVSPTPFTVLPLALPCTPLGTVVHGTTLTHCLLRYSQAEVLQGVDCTRCSLRASLQPLQPLEALQQRASLQPLQPKAAVQPLQPLQPLDPNAGLQPLQNEAVLQPRQLHQQQEQEPQQEQQQLQQKQEPQHQPQEQQQELNLDAHSNHHHHEHQPRQQPQQQQQPSWLQLLVALSDSQQPLPPLDYPHLLQQHLQLQWVTKKSTVMKRTVLARLPPVLLLQLQRATHVAGRGAKVQGFVRFPLQLRLGNVMQAMQEGQQQQEQEQEQQQSPIPTAQQFLAAATIDQHQQQDEVAKEPTLGQGRLQTQSNHQQQQQVGANNVLGQEQAVDGRAAATAVKVEYDLVSVVQHLGSGYSWGHYIMYRNVQERGVGSTRPGCSRWVRVSDSTVSDVSEIEVLQCDATLLVYEQLPTV